MNVKFTVLVKRAVCVALMFAFALTACISASATLSGTGYVYNDALDNALPELDSDDVKRARNPADAFTVLLDTVPAEKRSDADVLWQLALYAEYLACDDAVCDSADASDLRRGTRASSETLEELVAVASEYGIAFPRKLRAGVTVRGDESERVAAEIEAMPDGLDYISFEIESASLTVKTVDMTLPVNVALFLDVATDAAPEQDIAQIITETLTQVWSVAVAVLLFFIWIIVKPLRRKKITWFIPVVLSIAAVGINRDGIINYANKLTGSEPAQKTAAVKHDFALPATGHINIELDGVKTAALSYPVKKQSERELVAVTPDGIPAVSRYNAVTGALEARIAVSGAYGFKLMPTFYTDVADKDEEVRRAVRVLTACGLMSADGETSFLPDRAITRAEFLAVALNIMNLLDESAVTTFSDVMRGDWYYAVAASAEKEGLITGYADGTFRGNREIPKGEMVNVAANVLLRLMDYAEPVDIDTALSVYNDADVIADWLRPGAAVAASAGIVPQRADGAFGADGVMTRGDAAVMLYRLFMRVW